MFNLIGILIVFGAIAYGAFQLGQSLHKATHGGSN